jgi:hypothetical protein
MPEQYLRGAITKVLRAHRAVKLFHVTPARNLPNIVASSALLSPRERGTRSAHSWGANTEAGNDLVCLSFWPSWAMVKNQMQGKELVILGFDAPAIDNLESALFCPLNSANRTATPYLADGRDPIETLAECVDPSSTLNAAEVLIPDEVSLSALRQVVFSDQATMDTWWPAVRVFLGTSERPVTAWASRAGTFPWFPPDHAVTERTQPSPGTDQRCWLDDIPDDIPDEPVIPFDLLEPEDDEQDPDSEIRWIGPEELDDEDSDGRDEWEDDGPPSWADFYDDGEPDDPEFYELSIRDP